MLTKGLPTRHINITYRSSLSRDFNNSLEITQINTLIDFIQFYFYETKFACQMGSRSLNLAKHLRMIYISA